MLSQGLPDVFRPLTPHAVYNARAARELKRGPALERRRQVIAADQYIITPDQGDWAIRYNGDCLGRFASCSRAIRAAVEVADTASSSHQVCEVVVERSPSDRYTVWVRGTDGFSH